MSESKFVEVSGYRIHYTEEGQGDAALFIHGNPTSSLLWRNILPPVSKALGRRGIAIDLLGFGKSDKPNREYSLPLHFEIVKGFIEKLELRNVALVLQDWGGTLGMRYAVENPRNIRAIAAMETFLWDMRLESLAKKYQGMFKTMRSPMGFVLLQLLNMTDKMIDGATLPSTRVPDAIMKEYKGAFPTIASRKAPRDFTRLILVDGKPESSQLVREETERGLASLSAPVCLIRATPGTEYSDDFVASLKAKLPQLESLAFGPGGHYLQEDDPERVARILIDWFRSKGL